MSTRIQVTLIAAVAIAFASAFLRWRVGEIVEEMSASERGPSVVVGVLSDEEHRVTTEMQEASEAMSDRPAPAFRAIGQDGIGFDSASIVGDRPLVLVFIKDGCPCSTSAEPFYARLHAAYGDEATFLGVIDGDRAVASRWVDDHGTPYPVLADPSLDIVRSFEVRNSAYVALIDRAGQIEALWPGYSEGILNEISARLADLTGLDQADVGADQAPELPYSGCPFPIELGSEGPTS
jgi:peroxiredoxin